MKNLLAYTPETFDNLELENFEYAPLADEMDMEEGFVRGKQSRPRMARIKTMPRRSIASPLRKPVRIPRLLQILPRQPMRPLLPPRIGAAASLNVFPPADDRRPSGQSSSSGNAGGEGSFANAPAQDLSSEHVRWVQETLNRALGLRLIVDGIMNRETRSAVRMFQERKGLPVTGLVGPDTENMLVSISGGSMSEEDLFLGKIDSKVSRAASGAVNSASKAVRKTSKTAYKAGKKGAQYAGKHAGKAGSLALPPGAGAAIKFGRDVARGKNVVSSFKPAAKADIDDMRNRMRYAQIGASFVPGVGTGVSAALGAANALADGRPITDAVIEAARGAIPGGPLAQTAFDMGVNLARGQNVSDAALGAARNRLPAGARAAFDTAVALGKGQSWQQAVLGNASRFLPGTPSKYPYINKGLAAAQYARRINKGLEMLESELSSTSSGENNMNYELAFEAEPFIEAADLETFDESEMPDFGECSCGGREIEAFVFEAEPFNYAESGEPELLNETSGIRPDDERIDVRAKFALPKMLKRADASEDAARLIAGVNNGQLAGIYGDDIGMAVKIAKTYSITRMDLIPKGEDSSLVLDAATPLMAPPVVLFRGDTPDISKTPERFYAALKKASQTFLLWQQRQIGTCSDSGKLIPNLIPSNFCRIVRIESNTECPCPTGNVNAINQFYSQVSTVCQSVQPKLSFYQNYQSNLEHMMGFRNVARHIAQRICAFEEPKFSRSIGVGPTPYATGAAIIASIRFAYTGSGKKVNEVHVCSHSSPTGLHSSYRETCYGLYAEYYPLYSEERYYGARTVNDLPFDALSNDVVFVLRGCSTAKEIDPTRPRSFARNLFQVLYRNGLTKAKVYGHPDNTTQRSVAGNSNWKEFSARCPAGKDVPQIPEPVIWFR